MSVFSLKAPALLLLFTSASAVSLNWDRSQFSPEGSPEVPSREYYHFPSSLTQKLTCYSRCKWPRLETGLPTRRRVYIPAYYRGKSWLGFRD